MSKDLSDNMLELNEAVKNYFQTKLDLAKLTVLEKITRFSLYLISFQITILFFFLILAFLTTAFVIWYHQTYQDLLTGLLIASGFLIVTSLLFFVFRKKLITKNLLHNFSDILFDEDEK